LPGTNDARLTYMQQSIAEPESDNEQQLKAALAALRVAGEHLCDPVGFHYMDGLAKRLPTQSDAVRRLLVDKLQLALAGYAQKLSQSSSAQSKVATLSSGSDVVATSSNSLAELNRYLESRTRADVEVGLIDWASDNSEMKSVRQFKQAWSQIQAEDQVKRAVLQGPKNPGPINSHTLVLRTLTLMRHLSPAYLQRFLSQADALLCLDRVTAKGTSKPAVVVSKARSRSRLKK